MLRNRKPTFDAPETGTDTRPRAAHSGPRGLGPFTGGQLTIIIVTVAILLLVPFGAWAVAGSNVFVTDATSGGHANVSANALTVQPAPPKASFERHRSTVVGTQKIAAPSAGHAMVITEVLVDTFNAPVLGFAALRVSKQDATCSHTNDINFEVNPPGVGTLVIPINPGLVVPGGRALCVQAGGIGVDVFVYGHQVPAASAPSGN